MNTCRTDHTAWEIDNRARYRQLLASSQLQAGKDPFHYEDPYHYDFHDTGASLWECLGWSLFALLVLGGLAEALMWGLR